MSDPITTAQLREIAWTVGKECEADEWGTEVAAAIRSAADQLDAANAALARRSSFTPEEISIEIGMLIKERDAAVKERDAALMQVAEATAEHRSELIKLFPDWKHGQLADYVAERNEDHDAWIESDAKHSQNAEKLRAELAAMTKERDDWKAKAYEENAKCAGVIRGSNIISAKLAAITKERDAAVAEVARLTKERDHWKSNHDNQVAIKHAVLDRPDLGDQSRSVLALTTDRDELRAHLVIADQTAGSLRAALDHRNAKLAAAEAELGRARERLREALPYVCNTDHEGRSEAELEELYPESAVIVKAFRARIEMALAAPRAERDGES